MIEIDGTTRDKLRSTFTRSGILMLAVLLAAAVVSFLISLQAAKPIRAAFMVAEHSAYQAMRAQNISHMIGNLTVPFKLRKFTDLRNDLASELEALVVGNYNLFAGNAEIGLPKATPEAAQMFFVGGSVGLNNQIPDLEARIHKEFLGDLRSIDPQNASTVIWHIRETLNPQLQALVGYHSDQAQRQLNFFVFYQVVALAILLVCGFSVWLFGHNRLSTLVQRTLTPDPDYAKDPTTKNFNMASALPNTAFLRDVMMDEAMALKGTERVAVILHLRFVRMGDLKYGDDKFLKRAIQRDIFHKLQSLVRPGDFVSQASGTVFVLSLGGLQRPEDAAPSIRAILAAFAHRYAYTDRSADIVPSIGVAIMTGADRTPDKAMNAAAKIQTIAAEVGILPVLVANRALPTNKKVANVVSSGLEAALENGSLAPVFLAIHNANLGHADRVQAMLRWTHPKMGAVESVFLDGMISASDLVQPASERLISETVATLKSWDDAGLQMAAVSFRLDKAAFCNPKTLETLRWALDTHNIQPTRILVEIDDFILDTPEVADPLGAFVDFGVGIAARDHGSEDFDLAQRKKRGIDGLILQRLSVANIDSDPARRRLTGAKIRNAGKFGSTVIVEDVVTDREYRTLREFGTSLHQGPLFAAPLTAQQVLDRWASIEAAPPIRGHS